MNGEAAERIKQYIGFFGGLLGAILLFLQSIGITLDWLTESSIDAFINVLLSAVPFILAIYGIYKNHYFLTEKKKEQEEVLKRENLK